MSTKAKGGGAGLLLAAGIAVVAAVFMGGKKDGGSKGGALQGFAVRFAQTAGMASSRTATATGKVLNNGNVTSTYRLHLQVSRAPDAATIPTVLKDVTADIALAAGATSTAIAITAGDLFANGGEILIAVVSLDRLAPEAAQNIARTQAFTYIEPSAVGGALSNFTISVAQRGRYLRSRR